MFYVEFISISIMKSSVSTPTINRYTSIAIYPLHVQLYTYHKVTTGISHMQCLAETRMYTMQNMNNDI